MGIVERLRELAKAADEQTDKAHGDFHRMLADTIQQQVDRIRELDAHATDLANHIIDIEKKLAEAEPNAKRYEFLTKNYINYNERTGRFDLLFSYKAQVGAVDAAIDKARVSKKTL